MSAQQIQRTVFGRSEPFSERVSKDPDATPAPTAEELDREAERLAALDRLDVLDTPREEAFDRITRLTKKLFDAPIAIVSFIDAHRQWYKSCEGMETCEAAREDTFCRHVIESGTPLAVSDAREDARFEINPFVAREPGIRSYLGVPLQTADGHNVGTLCVIDTRARAFGESEIDLLTDLARLTMDELELRQLAARDSLTGAMTRRTFKEEGRRLTGLALRQHDELACVALDLDHFKSINDRFGHAGGDAVLVEAVKRCREQLRDTDVVGRLGGEEFGVLLPGAGLDAAFEVAEKLRRTIEERPVEGGGRTIGATASFGVAALDQATRDFDTLLRNADLALYAAKQGGRNRSVAHRPAPAAKPAGRRVLKGGRILFNANLSSIDCTVRSLSEEGAGLDVTTTVGIPKRFTLSIPADDFERPVRVTVQAEKHIEVAFL